jgi:trk system potassium uptake protein TrkH
MIHYRSIFFFIGWLLVILAGAMLFPLVFELTSQGQDAKAYGLSMAVTLFLGGLLVSSHKTDHSLTLGKRDTFLLTLLSWTFSILFSTLPFLLSNANLSLTDAFFESVSGMTTTGATILTGLDHANVGILIWRAMLHWLGGIGIVVMALTIMADLRIGGMELFQADGGVDPTDKLFPRIRQITQTIFLSYISVTIIGIAALYSAKLSFVDAFCHTLSCISTGGFSNYDASIGHYNSLPVELILTALMIIGGLPQLLFARLWVGKYTSLFEDSQLKTYIRILIFVVLSVSLWRILNAREPSFPILVHTLFNITSVMTTTGFASENYILWGSFATILFFILPFIGGCTGSTTGGLKIFRLQVIWTVILVQLKKLRRPHGIFLPKFKGKELSESLVQSIIGFVMLFFLSCFGLALLLSFLGLDFITAFSGACSMLTNLGPCLSPLVGPEGTYAHFTNDVKWLLMIGMIFGRLELLTLYILFLPSFWKD